MTYTYPFRIITSSSLTPFVVNTSIEVVLFDELYNVSHDLVSLIHKYRVVIDKLHY